MKRNRCLRRVKVSADGEGLSRAGVALLRELTVDSGLAHGWTAALLDTYRAVPVHEPGRVLAELVVVIADGVRRWRIWARCAIRTSCSGASPPTRRRGAVWSGWMSSTWPGCGLSCGRAGTGLGTELATAFARLRAAPWAA